jgi:hypothetical protein
LFQFVQALREAKPGLDTGDVALRFAQATLTAASRSEIGELSRRHMEGQRVFAFAQSTVRRA